MVDAPLAYGIREKSAAIDEVDVHAEEIKLLGYTVMDSGLPADKIGAIADGIATVIARQEAEFGGAEAMESIGDANTGRALLAYDPLFLELAANERLIALVRRLLGEYIVLSQQNSIVLRPSDSHAQARYHRDLPYQHFTSSRPLAVNALFCVDPFTLDNGATRVLPGSHKYEPFPSDAVVRRQEKVITAPAGSFLVLDAMLYHSGGVNLTTAMRRGVNHVFVLPFMRQQIDLPRMLNGRYAEDPFLRQLLGYDCQTPGSVLAWREERIARTKRSD